MDEMAETLGLDPVEFRLMHITRPATRRHALSLRFVSLRRGVAGRRQGFWMGEAQLRCPARAPGRFKRGFGMGMSQHHGGLMGYHEGEDRIRQALAEAPARPSSVRNWN